MTSAVDLDTLPPVAAANARDVADIDALLAAGEPVLLRDAVLHWPACKAGRASLTELDAYLRARDGGAPVPVMQAPAASGGRFAYGSDLREFSFSKRSRALGETLDRIALSVDDPAGSVIAIQMLPLDAQMPGFMRDNPMPLVPADAAPKLWLGGPVKTQIHNDRDHNLACVIAGHRRFVLFPPEQVSNLYIGPLETAPALSLVDPEAPDLARFPRFREALAAARVAHLGPGDALLMPRYWWHHVTSLDRFNAMVNYWWGKRPGGLADPHEAFLVGLLALKELSAGERAYWRAMFDAHVFNTPGESAAHIPSPLRGMLGALTPGLRALLKQRLKGAAAKW